MVLGFAVELTARLHVNPPHVQLVVQLVVRPLVRLATSLVFEVRVAGWGRSEIGKLHKAPLELVIMASCHVRALTEQICRFQCRQYS